MNLFPVIMCGGAGTRLWPSSRPSLPKQFMQLAGSLSLFQDTALRVADLCGDGGQLVVIGGEKHRPHIVEQLQAIGVRAQILLEPAARDSAAAMAAAAVWTETRDPLGVNIFVASDHYVPNAEAFRDAVRLGAPLAMEGRIVTLGVQPTEPSAAYGYIRPEHPGLSPVHAFVEKPTAETAARYIEEGYLWNSGNFIARASVLLAEIREHFPAVEAAVRLSVPTDSPEGPVVLSRAFTEAPGISIDYAVMERTSLASVLPVAFSWSDLGAWDAVAATGEGSRGIHVFEGAERCLVRAADGVVVAAIGVHDLAIIVEQDAVLVCDLARSQDVKRVVERLKLISPQHLDFSRPRTLGLVEGGCAFQSWLRLRALSVWSSLGQAETGAFAETLTKTARSVPSARRARVQMRQIQVFAEAGRLGWQGQCERVVNSGLGYADQFYRRPDGVVRTRLEDDGRPLDETPFLYDQAFYLFALAAANTLTNQTSGSIQAEIILEHVLTQASTDGGFVEAGEYPYQSNAHMHLLEASLAWEDIQPDGPWAGFTDRIVSVAKTLFIDRQGGFLREFFDGDWKPAPGGDGRLVEPGHQFEWAWLMARYGRSRGDAEALNLAHSLHAFGVRGVDPVRQVAVDELDDDGSVRSPRARLWPQTEWLKASLILAELSMEAKRAAYLDSAASAMNAISRYLTPDGLWHDKMLADGSFVDEPAPASSFYHIMAAYSQLAATHAAIDLGFEGDLRLD